MSLSSPSTHNPESPSLSPAAWLSSFYVGLSAIPDPRSSCDHTLADLLFCSVCAVASGADGFTDVAVFAKTKLDWLRRFIPLSKGAPSHDTFRYLFMLLKPFSVHKVLSQYLAPAIPMELVPVEPPKSDGQVAIDGKAMRGSASRSKGLKATHILRAYIPETGVCVGYRSCDEKSNEITALPDLLKALNLNGCLVTIDAMGCQTEVISQIVKQGGDYLIPVKENQPTAHEALSQQAAKLESAIANLEPQAHDPVIVIDGKPTLITAETLKPISAEALAALQRAAAEELQRYEHSGGLEHHHGRCEQRDVYAMTGTDWWPKSWKWEGVQSVIFVRRRTLRADGKSDSPSEEWSYYISSRKASAVQFAKWIRRHWTIENSCHHVLDVTFDEDHHQLRDAQTAINFSILRDWATALLKAKPSKQSLAARRKQAGWSDDYRSSLISQMFQI